ncbi:MAG: carboxymuconolactone decarboxylase family protein [Gammaproteobacteria bacterium]|nr:carboxymuconolactone decarboxylase family protein [Gammaproteobacteria bacterium]
MSDDAFEHNERFERGLALRRAVLGDAHVQRSLDKAAEDPFMVAIQQLTTEFGWGEVWARPGLERKTRSFLSMAFLAARGKTDEFKTHVRGAVNNGASREEISEVLIQAAVYCGFPVALECFRLAKEVLDEMEKH